MILGTSDTPRVVKRDDDDDDDNCPFLAPIDCNNGFCCPFKTVCQVVENAETDCVTDFGRWSGYAIPAVRGDGATTSSSPPATSEVVPATSSTSTFESSTSTPQPPPPSTTIISTATATEIIQSTVTVTPTPASTPSSSSVSTGTSIVESPPPLSSSPPPIANTNTQSLVTLLPTIATSPPSAPPSFSSSIAMPTTALPSSTLPATGTNAPVISPSQGQATATATALAVTSQPPRLSTSQTVAVIVAPIAAISLAILAFFLWRRRQRKTKRESADLQITRTMSDEQFFPPPEVPAMREDERAEQWTQEILPPPRPIRESWMSFGESSRQWVGGGSNTRARSLTLDQIDDQDDKAGTLITIKGVFPADPSSPSEVYVPDHRHLPGSMDSAAGLPIAGDAGNPLTMNPIIRGGRGPPLRLDTLHWPLS